MPYNIFIFGGIGSGKSTICAALSNYYIMKIGTSIHYNWNNIEGTKYFLESWIKRIQKKMFPEKTFEDTFIRVDIAIEDRNKKEKMGLSFFEASGEHIIRINPVNEKHDKCEDIIHNWLKFADVIIVVAPCLDCDEVKFNLSTFLSYLIFKKITQKPIAFVLSKADLISTGFETYTKFGIKNYKEPLSLLRSNYFNNTTELFPFSIGKIDPENPDKFLEIDYSKGTAQIGEWILYTRRKKSDKN